MIPRIIPLWAVPAAFVAGAAIAGTIGAGVASFQKGRADGLALSVKALNDKLDEANTAKGQALGANAAFAEADRRVEAACTIVQTDVAAAKDAARAAEKAAQDATTQARRTAGALLALKPSGDDLCVAAATLFDAQRELERAQ